MRTPVFSTEYRVLLVAEVRLWVRLAIWGGNKAVLWGLPRIRRGSLGPVTDSLLLCRFGFFLPDSVVIIRMGRGSPNGVKVILEERPMVAPYTLHRRGPGKGVV